MGFLSVQSILPPGTVLPFAGSSAPAGWALCDGSAVSRTTYNALFSAVGVAHGYGDNSTTFNLPDYRGRFLRGLDSAAGRDPDSASRTAMNTGGNTGNAVGAIQGHAFNSHQHGVRNNNLTSGQGFTTLMTNQNATGTWGYVSNTDLGTPPVTPTGGNETRPLNANVNYIIKL